MPQDTLNFALQSAQEWIELRHLVHEKEAKVDSLLVSEAAYVDLLDTLAKHPIMLKAMPELMSQATEEQHPVLSHLIFRTLQADWCHSWLTQIQAQTISLNNLNFVGFLPSTILESVLLKARSMDGLLRVWAAQFISRNHLVKLSQQWFTDKEGVNDKAIVALLGQFRTKEHHATLQGILAESEKTNNDKKVELTVHVALALMHYQDPQGANYLRRPEIITHPASGYGEWLANLGTQQDLRLIEQSIEQQIKDYDESPTIECLRSIVGMIQTLGHHGDAQVAMWCYRQLLPQEEPRLRSAGFSAMLELFDPNLVTQGYLQLEQAPNTSDELGGFSLLEFKNIKMYWDNLQQQVGKQQILPSCRCRAGKPYDQLNDIIEQLRELTYGDSQTADRLRLLVAILTDQSIALDSHASYQTFITQQSNIIIQIEHFRKASQYVPGSFKLGFVEPLK